MDLTETAISVGVDGVTRISVTDSSFSSGEVGLWSYDPSSANQHVFDDFVVTNLGQGSVPGVKVMVAFQAAPHERVKDRPNGGAWMKSVFTLTRQTGQVWKSYYYAGAARVAMREVNDEGSEVFYILSDHLDSTSITVNDAGQRTAQVWYKPWGEVREVWGVLPTERTFQGQQDSRWGLLNFRARWFDPYLNRWTQPDSIIPGYNDPQSFDRYAFVRNNPVNRIDPTGHMDVCPDCGGGGVLTDEEKLKRLRELREEDRNQNSEVPFDTSLGSNVKGFETSLLKDDAEKNNVNIGKVVLGITLIIGGGLMFVGGAQATFMALANPHLAIEFAPLTALVAVAGGSFVFIGIYTLVNSGMIPETKLKR